jgi:hypothetical protein
MMWREDEEKALVRSAIEQLRNFRKNHRLEGLSLRELIDSGRDEARHETRPPSGHQGCHAGESGPTVRNPVV